MTQPASTSAEADIAMSRYASGDDAAFGTVYDVVAPRLLAHLLRRTGNRQLAEDVVQEAFLNMHRARGSFQRGASVLAWAFAIARRLHIDRLRRGRHDSPTVLDATVVLSTLVSHEPSGDAIVHARQLVEQVARVLDALPASQRVAFELLKLDGLSLSETALALGTTVMAVKLRAHRAYEALRLVIDGGS